MRILLLTHYFAPENAAPQRRWDGIGRELVAAGHEVHVICPPPHYPEGRLLPEHREEHGAGCIEAASWGGIVHRSGYLPHGSTMLSRTADHLVAATSAVRIALRRLEDRRPDVIIATAPGIPTIIAGRMLGWRWMVPVVVEMRDAWPDLVTHVPGIADGTGPIAAAKRFVHTEMSDWQRRAAHVVTTTQRFADVLEGRGVARPTVIRNGVAVELYERVPPRPAVRRPPRAASGVEPAESTYTGEIPLAAQLSAAREIARARTRPLRALYMGNLGRSQGLDMIIRAAARLRDAGVRLEVRIIGFGAEARNLRLLNALLRDPVDLRDGIPPSEVAEHYAWADTTIVSLRDWGPFEWTVPSKLYELLAVGRHITCILGGEGAEIVAETGAGDIVAPGDEDGLTALWALLAADPEGVEDREGGRAWVREHVAFPTLGRQYLEVLDRVVEEARTTPPGGGARRLVRHLARSAQSLRSAFSESS